MSKHFDLRQLARLLRESERGSQVLEAAIALPILLMLMGATAEFGRFFYTYTTLTSAVRAGARHASKWERNASWTVPETRRMVVFGDFSDTSKGAILPGLTEGNVNVTANGPENNVQSVTVSITGYQYQPIFDLGKLTGVTSLSLKINMNANATMKQLFNGPVA